MSETKLFFYRLQWILRNFPEFWKALDKANQLAFVLIPLGLVMALLGIPLADLIAGAIIGIFVTKYLQRLEDEER